MSSHTQITALLSRGDVFYNLRGNRKEEVLATLVRISKLPKSLDKPELIKALMEREGLASTAMGEGFALPHPRHHLLKDEAEALVTIGYLDMPVEWGSPDGAPVSVVFLVLSAGVEQHLTTISALACLTQSEDFKAFLQERPTKTEILAFIEKLPGQCEALPNPVATR